MTKKKITRKRRATTKAAPPPSDLIAKNVGWPWPLRPYQQRVEDAFSRGIDRFLLPWHRRAGKDVFCLSKARQECVKRIGGYVHFYPKHVAAKRAIWRGVDPKTEKRFIDTAFGDIEADRNNQDMFIEMINGSTWQLLGSDNYNNIVGSNIVGAVFSEYALCDPRALDYIMPMIIENGGWVVIISTFRGRNHMWQLYETVKNDPDWYTELLTVDDTTDIDGHPIIDAKEIEKERRRGKTDAFIQQEYFCNPEAVSDGAIYGKQIEQLRKDENRHDAKWNPNFPVYAVWNFDLPVFAACVYIQNKPHPQVLGSKTFPFTTLGEAVSGCYRQPFPVQKHLISAKHMDLVNQLSDLSVYPEVLHLKGDYLRTTATANFLNTCRIAKGECDEFLDALGGYVRRERFDTLTADLVFSDNPAPSWHGQLAEALEVFAAWAYYGSDDDWSKTPDYSIQDKIARTIL